jgi:hypothetical protein
MTNRQWGIVLGAQVLFVMFAEAYKLWKRRSNFWNPPGSRHFGEGVEPVKLLPGHEDDGFVENTIERWSNMALDDQIHELEMRNMPVPVEMRQLSEAHKNGSVFGFDATKV